MFFRNSSSENPGLAHRLFGATFGSAVLFMVEILQIMVIAAAIVIPIRIFLIKPFIVKGASMEPNFHDDEYLIVDEITYHFADVKRGDVIVFRPPNNPGQNYIKRVIGLPGETVEIIEGTIRIYNAEYPNGVILREDYLSEYTHGRQKVTLGLDEFYVLGDNRDASLDSRKIGAISSDAIIGKVWIRGLPLDKAGAIKTPEYLY